MNISKSEIKRELWHRGQLRWKCHKAQEEMYDLFYKSPVNSTLVWLLARQTGKSYLLGILALEQALRKGNSIIKIVTDTKLHIKSILEPIFRELLNDCPQSLKPDFKKNDCIYYFSNGSQIQLAGTDSGHYEKLRGQKSELILVDEAGFCSDLHNIITSVLIPTTTHTGGKIVLASTPSNDPDHEFIKFIEQAEIHGLLTKKTVYDNPLLTPEQVARIAEKIGGVHSEQFRREYLVEIIKDTKTSVIPEFTIALEKEIVREWPRPPFFDAYCSMDIGGRDLTAVLFAYYDFRADKVIIEDELVFDFRNADNTLKKFVTDLKGIEDKIWLDVFTNEVRKPYLRISDDNNPIFVQEISNSSDRQINFQPTKKDESISAINVMRMMIQNKRIIINPRCTTLIRHLRNVKWNKDKSSFSRSPDNGHYDCVDALKYLIRNISYTKNPYPSYYGYNTQDLYVVNKDKFESNTNNVNIFKKIFRVGQK